MSLFKKNILHFIDFKGIRKSDFYRDTRITRSVLDKKSGLTEDNLAKFIATYPEVNYEWLLTGKGEMLKDDVRKHQSSVKDSIPLVNVTAIGGFGNSNFSISERDIKAFYVIPKFKHKKVDFMIEVEGSSMYPKYNSGDVVACTMLKESSFLQWNKTHVIATKEQGIIIKRIKKGKKDNVLCMISDNPNYDPFDVPKDEILGIALVVGVIRLE